MSFFRAVRIRRTLFEMKINKPLTGLPLEGIDYEAIFGANCETVIGYLSVPVGVVGPFVIDGNPIYVPMATTEGCLVASTNRYSKLLAFHLVQGPIMTCSQSNSPQFCFFPLFSPGAARLLP